VSLSSKSVDALTKRPMALFGGDEGKTGQWVPTPQATLFVQGVLSFSLLYKSFFFSLISWGFFSIFLKIYAYYRSRIKCPFFTRKLRWSDDNRTPHTILKTKKPCNVLRFFPFLFLNMVWGTTIISPSVFL
jgi:hypothetical protein